MGGIKKLATLMLSFHFPATRHCVSMSDTDPDQDDERLVEALSKFRRETFF